MVAKMQPAQIVHVQQNVLAQPVKANAQLVTVALTTTAQLV